MHYTLNAQVSSHPYGHRWQDWNTRDEMLEDLERVSNIVASALNAYHDGVTLTTADGTPYLNADGIEWQDPGPAIQAKCIEALNVIRKQFGLEPWEGCRWKYENNHGENL